MVSSNALSWYKRRMNQLTVELPSNISIEEARLLLSVKLFETEKLSLGQAAKLAGYSKRTFIELLGKMGEVSVT
jgi:predicted HTH domain antitoxin